MRAYTIILPLAAIGLANCSKSEFSAGAAGFRKAQLTTEDPSAGPDNDDAVKGGDPMKGEEKPTGNETPDNQLPAVVTTDSGGQEVQPCAFKAPRTAKTSDGYVEYNADAFKPGIFGQPSAVEGFPWPNGGTNKPWGDGTSTLDWNVCPKIAFKERGHSLTRTILFKDPPGDAELFLRVHRFRNANESLGVGIWYHFDKRVTWTGPALHNFQKIQDYNIKCVYTAAKDSYVCSYTTAPLSAAECAGMSRPGVTCSSIPLAQ